MRFHERLLPPWWLFALVLLVVPASLIVFLPIAPIVGYVVAAVLYIGSAIALVLLSPVVVVNATTLSAGKATIPVTELGEPQTLNSVESSLVLGRDFDAAAFLCTVAWTKRLVRVPVIDASDPTTSWIMSTRKPEALAAAIRDAQQA